MAVPTLNTLDVVTGPTQGRTLVKLTGTNFRGYPAPNPTGITPTPLPPVRVLFGSRAAYEVQVESSTVLWCLSPVNDPGVVSVTVTNLDTNGTPIGGETVVKANAFTFVRPYVRNPASPTQPFYNSDLYRLCGRIAEEFERQVLPNAVLKKPHSEFSDVPVSTRVRLSELPAVVLWGPKLSVNRFLTDNSYQNETTGATTFKARRPVEARDVTFDITIVSDNMIELLNIIQVTERFFDKNHELEMDRSATDPSLGTVVYDLVYTVPVSTDDDVDDQNRCSATGSFFIRGFEMQNTAGFVDDAIEHRGDTVESIDSGQVQKEEET